MKEKNLNKILKTSIVTFSILTVINCIGILGSSHALFEKSIDSKNKINFKVVNYANPGVTTASIANLAKKDKTNLTYDETTNNNLRYIGKDPNNYVRFNNELWRIVGSFANISNGTTSSKRIKLVKNGYAYTGTAFDSNNSNDYSTSTLKTTLNGTYYNGLTTDAKNMIDNAVWNIGGFAPTFDASTGSNAANFYAAERSSTVYSGHATTWTGKVGLMYPSDYLYATSGSSSVSRTTCLSTSAYSTNSNWYNSSGGPCAQNDYLFDISHWQCTISPYSGNSSYVFGVDGHGLMRGDGAGYTDSYSGVRPTLYLKPSIEITGGYGTKNKPYTLGYNEYKITYDLDGGTVSTNNPTSYTSQSNDINLNNPTKEGYKFVGWTGTGLDKAAENVTIPSDSTGNREYKANWVKTYTITVTAGTGTTVSGGGTCEKGSTVSFNGSANEHYTWNGWTDGNSSTSRTTTCNNNKTFTTNAATKMKNYTYTKTANASYTNVSAVTKGNWIGIYTCQNGTATLTSCKFSGTVGGTSYNTVCDGGGSGSSATYMCTHSSGSYDNLHNNCSTILPYNVSDSGYTYTYNGLGGGMPSSESC